MGRLNELRRLAGIKRPTIKDYYSLTITRRFIIEAWQRGRK
jgi:hypothetical protein